MLDTEATTLRLYDAADVDPEYPPGPHEVALRLGVEVRYDARKLMGASRANFDPSRNVIWLRPGLSLPTEMLMLWHELAERELLPLGWTEGHEQLCDQLAYRLRMPRPGFAWVAEEVGPAWTALARPWFASHVAAGLRWGEVTGEPTAVVTHSGVRYRGERWAWPHEEELLARVAEGSLHGHAVDRVRGGAVVRAR